jgi:hypothetical protein
LFNKYSRWYIIIDEYDVPLENSFFRGFYDEMIDFYHGFLLGSLVMKRYIIKSNREAGKGRSDIVIRYPNSRGAAVILELKVAKNIRQLEEKCDEALRQIEDKEYDKPLLDEGYTNILKYGITFYKKDCMIKKSTNN